ncbi:Eukaryotic translation initiation factor 3 subunit J [Sesamum angolense]|uniref:Eukaryotic translation initiation factor 3 subunit J n=1 Tax=Sesamum angolense TaxID=2727404 RepID=A0AAE1WTU4_9LAMI|nr:Eukaryotic translation initiation factor 3 subunit J [Sesamum angolense]
MRRVFLIKFAKFLDSKQLCGISEDEPIPDLLKKKEQPKSNWDDEDLDDNDVKNSWEDEDEPAPYVLEAPKPEPPPPEKGPKKAAGKSGEKKGKAVEASKEAPLDPIEEKLRQQRLVEEADYKSTAELFAKRGDEKTLDNFIPKTESDFAEYAELVSHKLRPFEKSYHYIGLLKAVMRLSLTSLKGADAKEVASSVTAIANEKIKAEKELMLARKDRGMISISACVIYHPEYYTLLKTHFDANIYVPVLFPSHLEETRPISTSIVSGCSRSPISIHLSNERTCTTVDCGDVRRDSRPGRERGKEEKHTSYIKTRPFLKLYNTLTDLLSEASANLLAYSSQDRKSPFLLGDTIPFMNQKLHTAPPESNSYTWQTPKK